MTKKEHIPAEVLRANMPHGLSNLLSIYGHATQDEIALGMDWFPKANRFAHELSIKYGVAVDIAIDVIAALSPNVEWAVNQASAEAVIRYFVSGGFVPSSTPYRNGDESLVDASHRMPNLGLQTYPANVVKALWVLSGEPDMLRGPKVEPFADNIRNCYSDSYVTVDSHAIAAWLGWTEPGSKRFDAKFHPIVAADYKEAAQRLNILPLQFQAIVWLVKKRLSGWRL